MVLTVRQNKVVGLWASIIGEQTNIFRIIGFNCDKPGPGERVGDLSIVCKSCSNPLTRNNLQEADGNKLEIENHYTINEAASITSPPNPSIPEHHSSQFGALVGGILLSSDVGRMTAPPQ